MTQCIFITTQNINLAIMNDRNSKIEISVDLDENKIPEKIFWSAEDGNIKNKESKALFLSVWDSEKKESLRIDLWTKEMPLDEMKIFFHQTLVAKAVPPRTSLDCSTA